MKRRRWPDLVIVAAVLGLIGLGAWALWGDRPGESRSGPVEDVEGSSGAT